MSYAAPEEYTPTETEIDEVLSLYNEWLEDACAHYGNKTVAIDAVTNLIQTDEEAGRVFTWVAAKDASHIYDIDESFEEC